jgi:homocysteine S-methyltransferase
MKLTDKLANQKHLLIVEFKPDDPNLADFVERVKQYVDAVRLTALKNSADPNDPKRTSERICFESAIKVRREAQVDVITSIVCRDHLKDDGDMLHRLKESGIDNLLALYGDPNDPPYSNHYNFQSSVELIQWVRNQESNTNLGTGFCIAVGSDPTSKDIQKQFSTLIQKKDAGANLAITQPIFDPDQALKFFNAFHDENGKIPTLVGLLVPKSRKSLAFLEKRLGVNISQEVKERMNGKNVEEGMQIVREVYRALWSQVDGYYVYPWADRDLTVTTSLLKELEEQELKKSVS